MGEFSDWYMAFPSELEDLVFASAEELRTGWRTIALEDVLELEVAALAKLLFGEAHAYASILLHPEGARIDDTFSDDITSQPADEGVYVQQIPDDFIRALAALADADLPPIAEAWRARAKPLARRSRGEIVALLADMRRFAQDAVQRGKMIVNVFEVGALAR